ncbi:hypothetical protein UlMin_008997 [Ulmus minor]
MDSWRSKKALQLPEYPDQEELESVLKIIELFPSIVFAGEAWKIEIFKEFNANNIRDTFRILLQMGVVLMFGGQMLVIKVGRRAGQFTKPRSDPFVEKNGVKLPSYSGYNVNGDAFDLKSRNPDPQRMIRAYYQSTTNLNLLRAFTIGGHAAINCIYTYIIQTTTFQTNHKSMIQTHKRKFLRFKSQTQRTFPTKSQIHKKKFLKFS